MDTFNFFSFQSPKLDWHLFQRLMRITTRTQDFVRTVIRPCAVVDNQAIQWKLSGAGQRIINPKTVFLGEVKCTTDRTTQKGTVFAHLVVHLGGLQVRMGFDETMTKVKRSSWYSLLCWTHPEVGSSFYGKFEVPLG